MSAYVHTDCNASFVISNEVRDLPKRMPQIPTPAPQALDDNEGHVIADHYGPKAS